MSKKTLVPNAQNALDQFKMQAASEVGVNLTNGYNGNLTSKEAGSVGGLMVNGMTPTRLLIFKRPSRIKKGRKIDVKYTFSLMA